MANKEIISASYTTTTVAALKTHLDSLADEANALVTSETGVKMITMVKMTLTDGTLDSVTFTITWDIYDDGITALKAMITQIDLHLDAIENASTYTTVTAVSSQTTIVVTE